MSVILQNPRSLVVFTTVNMSMDYNMQLFNRQGNMSNHIKLYNNSLLGSHITGQVTRSSTKRLKGVNSGSHSDLFE